MYAAHDTRRAFDPYPIHPSSVAVTASASQPHSSQNLGAGYFPASPHSSSQHGIGVTPVPAQTHFAPSSLASALDISKVSSSSRSRLQGETRAQGSRGTAIEAISTAPYLNQGTLNGAKAPHSNSGQNDPSTGRVTTFMPQQGDAAGLHDNVHQLTYRSQDMHDYSYSIPGPHDTAAAFNTHHAHLGASTSAAAVAQEPFSSMSLDFEEQAPGGVDAAYMPWTQVQHQQYGDSGILENASRVQSHWSRLRQAYGVPHPQANFAEAPVGSVSAVSPMSPDEIVTPRYALFQGQGPLGDIIAYGTDLRSLPGSAFPSQPSLLRHDGHLHPHVSGLGGTVSEANDGRSYLPDDAEPYLANLPCTPPGARIGDHPALAELPPYLLQPHGERWHASLNPQPEGIEALIAQDNDEEDEEAQTPRPKRPLPKHAVKEEKGDRWGFVEGGLHSPGRGFGLTIPEDEDEEEGRWKTRDSIVRIIDMICRFEGLMGIRELQRYGLI